jgi:hypothetical protein
MQPLRLLHSASIIFLSLIFAQSTFAQTGNVGIGTTNPQARLHVADSAVMFTGPLFLPGITAFDPPISGMGTRMMWYPQKAAFRVGYVNGSNWDKDSIGLYSFATGFNTKAKGASSVSLGGQTQSIGDYSTSMGYFTAAKGNYSTSMGLDSYADGFASTAMGYRTAAVGSYTLSVGYGDSAIGESAVSMGYFTKARGFASTSMGSGTEAIGAYSFSAGYESQALGDYSVSIGNADTASNSYAISMGYKSKASGFSSTSIGFESYSGGSYSVSIGTRDTASNDYATSMGLATKASGYASTSMGGSTEATGSYSTAMGYATQATGAFSVSMGYADTASNSYAMSMGYFTNARGIGSTSMGVSTKALGSSSTSMGSETVAKGAASTSMGYQTKASGEGSVSMGFQTTARAYGSLAIGMFNDSIASSNPSSILETNPLFIIGNGASVDARSNAMVVLKNGNVGIGTSAPTRLLDVNGAMRLQPQTSAPASPTGGDLYYDNSSNSLRFFNNTTWISLSERLWTLNGNNLYNTNGGGSGRIGIGTTTPLARLHVADSSVVFTGPLTVPTSTTFDPPSSGQGTRMMWYPQKGAFRVGFVLSNNWDKDSIGRFSFASGQNNKAKGTASTSMGLGTTASGNNSTSMGQETNATSLSSVAIGRWNDTIAGSSATNWVATDPVLMVGNGTGTTTRSNALTVFKNGNTDISGFTQLGSDAPAIKIKKFTVTTASTQGGTATVSHSLNLNKILGVQASLFTPGFLANPSFAIIPGYTGSNGYEYNIYLTPTQIFVWNKDLNSANILSKTVNIIVTYEE